MARSKCYRQLNQAGQALKASTAATKAEPENSRNWVSKMTCEVEVGNKAQAVKDAQHALSLDPDIDRAIPQVAQVLQHEQSLNKKA